MGAKLVFPSVTPEHDLDLLPLARAASELLLAHYLKPREELETRTKADAFDLVTEADSSVQALTEDWLRRLSALPLVGEEGGAADGGSRFWSLDPLDGTREFVESQGEFAFQLALVEDGTPTLAAVALPAWDLVYLARAGQGCRTLRLSDGLPQPLPSPVVRRERLLLSRSFGRRSDLQELVAAHPAQDRLPCGGVGAKVHGILWGQGDTYLTVPEGMYGWDLAAPLLVARECGLHTSDLQGQELRVPSDRRKLPQGVLFTRPRFAASNLAFLGKA